MTTTTAGDIVIIGSRIAANMAAACFKQQHPDLRVTLVGRTDKQPPIVGESLTEYTAEFLRSIGMKEILETKHMPKFGLTYYFKEHLDDPSDRRYAVHEAPRIPNIPTFLINRFNFDDDLKELNRKRDVEFLEANVREIEFGKTCAPHTLTLKDAEGNMTTMTARWVVDCSGRRRFLAKKLGLHQEPKHQRSTFWFRLADFDTELLRKIDAVKKSQPPFDSYSATHHFLGKGNWIWCIPLVSPGHRSFISIGITYRPDLLGSITSLEEFLRQVDSEHPVVGDLVRSGTVVDVNSYGNYMYEARQLYSADRWFLVGDSADTSDPLYSTGLVTLAIQSTQVSELIRRDLEGECIAGIAHDFEMAYKAIRDTGQNEISTLYDVIHDPFQSHWRVHISSAVYFYFMLPQVLCGYMVDPVGARWVAKIGVKERKKIRLMNELLAWASPRLGPQPSEAIPNRYDVSVNWDLKTACDEKIPRYLIQLLCLMTQFRLQLLREAHWHDWHRHVPGMVADLAKALFLRVFFDGRSLKSSRAIRWFVRW